MTIFDEQISRRPNKYEFTDFYIEAMHEGFWTDKEFSFASDLQDFKINLSDQEKNIITNKLAP